MKRCILAAIRCSLIFTTVAVLFVESAQAYTVTLEQIGSDVVANGSGRINLTGLTLDQIGTVSAGIAPLGGSIQTGPYLSPVLDFYSGFTGPASFGSGFGGSAFDGTGDFVGIIASIGLLDVPHGYVSGHFLTDSMTFNQASLASLGATPGTYVWTWGTGLPNQNFTLIIEAADVPDGGSALLLLAVGLFALMMYPGQSRRNQA